MNRSQYFNYIEEKLNLLALRITSRGRINLLDLNIHSETFFADLINLLLDIKLVNLNQFSQNVEGIDLVDNTNKIIAQVSSTKTKQKIESSLNKGIFETYKGYRFIFIAISGNADDLRTKTYKNPHGAAFDARNDIYDIHSFLNIVLNMEISKQRIVYDLMKDELGSNDVAKFDSNLATIINVLAKENFTHPIDAPEINPFEIKRKIDFNGLSQVEDIIDDFKIYHIRVDEKYREFDKEGSNRSASVLSIIRRTYIKLSSKHHEPTELFFAVIQEIEKLIQESKNYSEMPYEELDMCVSILIVDAFIRCKIFKNPEGYKYASTR